MITGIGTDLVEIARVQKAIGRSSFLEKVYTEKERELIAAREVRAATNFAAKEAVAKAFGCGFAGIAPIEIEVLREASGMPYVVLHGRARAKAELLGITKIQVSLTDTKEYAQAYAVCEGAAAEDAGKVLPGRKDGELLAKTPDSLKEAGVPVVDAAGMKEADRVTIEEVGVPSLVLMERAALAVAERVKVYATKESRIGVLCGTGNNGGDGVAVARLLAEESYDATVLIKDATKGTPEFLQQMKIATAGGVPVCEPWETKGYDIIVDALFGIGLSKPVEGEYGDLLEQIDRERHIVIAVDIASGVSASDGTVGGAALHANETVTFGAAKWGHLLYPGKEYTGKLTVADIGFPKAVLTARKQGMWLSRESVDALMPRRPAYSNKGTFGKVAVIAGSKNMAGAAYFAACGAYRTGAGLVKIVTPECNREILQTLLPEAMLATYAGAEELPVVVEEAVRFADAVVIGPGLGQCAEAELLVSLIRDALYEKEDTPVSVWDADALNIL
ncbi:MAG: NAD(P)H-hydrate epimerase, partial [Lachnospiraceae bacterium]|nr:NAD(P)H-hydrate epimerase [Lachnospiraceae bacterium]